MAQRFAERIADATEDNAITLAGSTTQLADGTVVTVTLTDGTITISDTATVVAGRWTLSPLNLSGMASGTMATSSLTAPSSTSPSRGMQPPGYSGLSGAGSVWNQRR